MVIPLMQSNVIVDRKKFVIAVLLTMFVHFIGVHGKTSSDSWVLFARETNGIFDRCSKSLQSKEMGSDMWSCLKRNSLTLFDKITSTDVIPLTNNIQLVRSTRKNGDDDPILSSIIHATTPMTYDNITVDRIVWINHILRRSIDTLATHDIRLALDDSMRNDVGEARARHRFRIFPSMIFGMAVLGTVIIPLGFHMLILLGGKALFIAKMAFLIAIITHPKKHGGHHYEGPPYHYQHPPQHYPHPPHNYPYPGWERS